MRYLFALSLLFLSGCSTTPPAGEGDVVIVWNRVEEPHRVCEASSGRKSFHTELGCSHWIEAQAARGPRTCAIYAPEPRTEKNLQRFATLGHELITRSGLSWVIEGTLFELAQVSGSAPDGLSWQVDTTLGYRF